MAKHFDEIVNMSHKNKFDFLFMDVANQKFYHNFETEFCDGEMKNEEKEKKNDNDENIDIDGEVQGRKGN